MQNENLKDYFDYDKDYGHFTQQSAQNLHLDQKPYPNHVQFAPPNLNIRLHLAS